MLTAHLRRSVTPLLRPAVLTRPLERRFAAQVAGDTAGIAGKAEEAARRFAARCRWVVQKKLLVPLPIVLGGVVGVNYWLQHVFGTQSDFFYSKYVTNADPDALLDFYQAENLLKIMMMHPFIFNLCMGFTTFSEGEAPGGTMIAPDETHCYVRHVCMDVAFVLIEEEIENDDGESVVGSFQRNERFLLRIPILGDLGWKTVVLDNTWTFGFKHIEGDTYEVYHHGEEFSGFWPVRLWLLLHNRYLIWACQRHVNSEAFGTDDLDFLEEEMAYIPVHDLHNFMKTLISEKEKDIALKKRAKVRDSAMDASIAEDEAALENLQASIACIDESTLSVSVAVDHNESGMSHSPHRGGKLVVGDAKTQEVMALAYKDAKDNKQVHDAIHNLIKNPELKFEERVNTRTTARMSMRQSVAPKIAASSVDGRESLRQQFGSKSPVGSAASKPIADNTAAAKSKSIADSVAAAESKSIAGGVAAVESKSIADNVAAAESQFTPSIMDDVAEWETRGSVIESGVVRYLPQSTASGRRLVPQADGTYMVSEGAVLRYRLSPNVDDKDPVRMVKARDIVRGELKDGWLRVYIE